MLLPTAPASVKAHAALEPVIWIPAALELQEAKQADCIKPLWHWSCLLLQRHLAYFTESELAAKVRHHNRQVMRLLTQKTNDPYYVVSGKGATGINSGHDKLVI